MIKLRKILLCNFVFYLLLLAILFLTIFRVSSKKNSLYKEDTEIIIGVITNISKNDNKYILTLKGKEKVICYLDSNLEKLKLNDKVLVKGILKKPNINKVPNTFNYQKYLKNQGVFWTFDVKKITILKRNNNIFFNIKNSIISKINNCQNSAYLEAFILGKTANINNLVFSSYQSNGISHLFAISGMHVTFLTTIIMGILKKIRLKEKQRYLLTSCFLLFYLFLTGIRASILRAITFFLLNAINKYYYYFIKPINIFYLTLSLSLIYNPYYIYDVGFKYSFVISFFLLKYQSIINSNNYFLGLFKVSVISFLASLPITVNNFFQINILSIFYNIFFVPLVSVIIFPCSLLTIILPIFSEVLTFFINILETMSIIFNKISFSKLIIGKLNYFEIAIYYIVLFIVLEFYKIKKIKYLCLILIIILYFYLKVPFMFKIIMIDVNQGDSTLIVNRKKAILIDTGGVKKTFQENTNYLSDTRIIPFLKSLGIKKINYLILTHGDYDHMGEAINLVNNFKVERVIFNCGEFNELEQELIEVLDKKKIPYYACVKELNIDDNKLYFLNNKDYGNENDNSNVIYTELNNHKFLFMGDAGVEVETELIEKYNLKDIDVLKVGHHGSKTSSSKLFIEKINPKYSIISVGKNNRYGHPNDSVLESLDESKIYRTDQDGSIMFKIKKNKLEIETCQT